MITQTYNLNLVPSENQVVVSASQYDEGSRRIEFILYHGRDLFDINDYEQKNNVICNVRVLGTKADGTGYMYDCGFSHSKAFFDIQEQMTVLAGQHTAEIRIVDNEDNIIGSSNFIFQIEKAALKDDTVISETDIPLLQRIINNIDSINAVETMLDGGTTGQVLAKKSDADGDVEWVNPGQGGSTVWGEISGILANQTDLKSELDAIELSISTLDNAVVHTSGNEEIYGQKTFNDKVFVKEIDGTEPAFLIVDLDENNVGLNSSGFYFNAFAPLWSAEKALYFPELQEGDFKTIATTDQIPVQTSQLENNSGFIDADVDNLTNYRTYSAQDAIDSNKQSKITSSNKLSSDLVDDANHTNKFVSATDISNWNSKVSDVKINNVSVVSSGVASLTIDNTLSNSSENAVQNKVVKGALDSKQDEITSSNKLNSDLITDTNQNNKFVSAQEKQDWNSKSDFSGNYNDLTNKPTIPTNVSQLNNDSGYLTLGTLPIYNGGVQ